MSTRRDFLRTSLGLGGAGLALGALPGIGSLAAASGGGGYKALVCIYLDGGLDGYDTVLPMDQGAYDEHMAARTTLAEGYERGGDDSRARGALRALGGAQADGRRFGTPRQMAPIADLYDRGQAVLVANVGPLREVTTRDMVKGGRARLPARLFSHNDQASIWQTSGTEGATSGWGGRLADAVAEASSPFTAVAIDAKPSFLSGARTRPFSLGEDGVGRIRSLTPWAFGSKEVAPILREHYRASGAPLDSYLASDFQAAQRRGVDASETLNGLLTGTDDGDAVRVEGSDLSAGLAMVAKLIGLRGELGTSRQVFFVKHGGYDTHDKQASRLPALQAELSDAVSRFHAETVRMGLADQVTTFTAGDFGRTLNANSSGTDHGWGGHHLVVGGAVRGGRIVGRMPEAGLKHDQAWDRGRLIPTTSVEQYAGALALWMGASPADLPVILPAIGRFDGVSELF